MKKCSNCGREAMNEAKFCQYCGVDVQMIKQYQKDNIAEDINADEVPPLPMVNEFTADQNKAAPLPLNKGTVWLVLSSITTFFGCCCLPLGFLQIVTIITSAISVSKYNKGEFEESMKMAKISKIIFFSILAFSLLLIIIILTTGVLGDLVNDYSDIVNEFY